MKNFTSVLAVCMLLNSTASFAQAGTLDSTFGGDGEVTTKIMVSSVAESVAIQDDGKILAAGSSYDGNTNNFALTKYRSDGTIDNNFGSNGIVITDFGGDDYGISTVIQSNGKILVAGYSYNGSANYDFALARYRRNGTPDSTFGVNGKVTTDLGGVDYGRSAAIQLNGKIVVAGYSINLSSGNVDFALVRYKVDGQLDSTFGTNGKVTTDFGGSSGGRSLVIQADGKILVAGFFSNGSNDDFALARYKLNGELDSGFGTNGKVTTDFGGDDFGQSVTIQANKDIVVAGSSDYNFALVRYEPNGTIDSSFDGNGKVTTDFGSFEYGQSVAMQADGKIVTGGVSFTGSDYDFALVRYRPNGKIDSAFGVNGKVTTDVDGDDYSSSVVIQTDGKIVEAGGSNAGFTVVRYNGDNIASAQIRNNNFSNLKKQENKVSPDIYLFPNPASDELHIRGLSSSAKTISVIDMAGRVFQKTVTANNNYAFDIKQLHAGIYFIKIDEGKKVTELKFIKR